MDSWMTLKEKGETFFKIKDYQKACDHYKEALTEIESQFDESNHELKVEAAKVASNISLVYLKISKERNDESLLHESKIYAKKTIRYNPKWIKGYLRLAVVCKLSKDIDDILNAITVYLQDNKDIVLNDNFKSLLKDVKYYTHKTVMELSPSWHLVKYKSNVYVVDSLGAGHFKDIVEFVNSHGTSEEHVSLLVRPGVYVGTYVFTDANIDIVGDCNIEINPTKKAIDKDSTVIFTNTLEPTTMGTTPNTDSSIYFFVDSKVSFKRISVYGKMDEYAFAAIVCQRTDINLLECSFFSECNVSLFCCESSDLYCKRCRCVGGLNGITISKSSARLTDCFISEIGITGIVARDNTEMIYLKHCTVTKCKKQGLLVCNGTKAAKVIDSYFEGNGYISTYIVNYQISLIGCRALVKNTSIIQSPNSVGINIEGGSVNFVNVKIEKCDIGISVGGNVEISDCFIDSSKCGIYMHNVLKGNIVLENISITNCAFEIARSDDAPMPTFKGEIKHTMITLPSINGENETILREIRKSRRTGYVGTNIISVDKFSLNKIFCDQCGMNELELQGSSKTLKVCGDCKMIFYCSPECQQKNWKIHEPICDFYVKTKLAAREEIKANQTNKERDSNETEENDGSGDIIVKKETTEKNYCSIL